MKINESFSNIIMVALNPSKFSGLSSNQKIVTATALTILSIQILFITASVTYMGIDYWKNRKVSTKTPNATDCYNLLKSKMGQGPGSFDSFVTGFRNEDFLSQYRRSKKNVIVPRNDFFTSKSFNPEEIKWIEWIIAYSGGIHRRGWDENIKNIAQTHFKAYVKLAMSMPNIQEMIPNIVSIVKRSSRGDYKGVDDLRDAFIRTCKENLNDPDVLNFTRLIAAYLPDYMNV